MAEPPEGNYPKFCGGEADQFVTKQSNKSLIISKRTTENNIEWSIRNLPYSVEVYRVLSDPEKKIFYII